jgi:hypothetical protein
MAVVDDTVRERPKTSKRGRPPGRTMRSLERDGDIIHLVESQIFRSVPFNKPGWSGRRYLTPFSVLRACQLVMRRGPILWRDARTNFVVADITSHEELRSRYNEAKKKGGAISRASIVWGAKFKWSAETRRSIYRFDQSDPVAIKSTSFISLRATKLARKIS